MPALERKAVEGRRGAELGARGGRRGVAKGGAGPEAGPEPCLSGTWAGSGARRRKPAAGFFCAGYLRPKVNRPLPSRLSLKLEAGHSSPNQMLKAVWLIDLKNGM